MTHLGEWEDNGWIGIKNAHFLKRVVYLHRKRTAMTSFKWVKGHKANLGNEESDKSAKEGANKEAPDHLSLDFPPEYDLQRAKLATLMQATAYKGIKGRCNPPPHPSTNRNLETIRAAIHEYQNTLKTNKTIWNNIRKHTICTRVHATIPLQGNPQHPNGRGSMVPNS
jgi:hypothetical protein